MSEEVSPLLIRQPSVRIFFEYKSILQKSILWDWIKLKIQILTRKILGLELLKKVTVSFTAIRGDGFIGRGITFRNSAGPEKHQAVAVRCGGDFSVFYRCGFEGYQDTLYVHSQRQFYRDCYIYGTVDFIFGNAAVVFQSCNIYARRPMQKQKNVITAQGNKEEKEKRELNFIRKIILSFLFFYFHILFFDLI